MYRTTLAALAVAALLGACSSSKDGGAGFQLVQFLEDGKDNLPRNRKLVFTFSAAVLDGQDFAERLKIQNVQVTSTGSNFARAIGEYLVSGEHVVFVPRLPQTTDRSDAGFRDHGSYVVFLKAGTDAIVSQSGDVMGSQLELNFETNGTFEDRFPNVPPRAIGLEAIDTTTGESINLGRLHPDPDVLAGIPNDKLLNPDDGSNARAIDPGAGGPPTYGTPWQLDLRIDDAMDPQTVTPANVQLLEIYGDALNPNNTADEGSFGTPNIPAFRVPIDVEIVQKFTIDGVDVRIRVTPQVTLVDDARYRLVFFGTMMGIDDRQQFVGDNGLTGDGLDIVEPGGQGYTTEFLVYDRPAIASSRTVLYDPLQDQINPEKGQTTDENKDGESKYNTALYNSVTPPGQPAKAVGFLSAFGDGSDGDFAASGGNIVTLDTGDEANDDFEQPFPVFDVDVNDTYSNTGSPPSGTVIWDSVMPREWQFSTLTISSSSTLRVIGVNPARFRVTGLVTINGVLDGRGGDANLSGTGGSSGAAGFDGGNGGNGGQFCPFTSGGSCASYDSYLNGCTGAKSAHPLTLKGEGPGRGHQGGETYLYYARSHLSTITGTGGGGGGHATVGDDGEDRANVGGADGTAGPACGLQWRVPNSGVIGVRGVGGSVYGDREVLNNLTGGSGGGGGGASSMYQFAGTPGAGGGGGGGGGVVEIISAGPINAIGGQMTVSGGNGSPGKVVQSTRSGWDTATGGGGGGAGGSLVMISGAGIDMSGGNVDAAGGVGGARGNVGTTVSCSKCNAGGDGGKGFIFLMDPDGNIPGLPNGTPGDYNINEGILTVRSFDGSRFSSITAITELFNVRAPDPTFTQMSPADISALVADDQTIFVELSSARADIQNPLVPDIDSESEVFEIAQITRDGNLVKVDITGLMSDLNPGTVPLRDAFVRVQARFVYGDPTEAALGPYAQIDRVKISFTFN